MMRCQAAVCVMAVWYSVVPVQAADPAQPGTRWVGVLKSADPKGKNNVKLTSTEWELTVKDRDGKKFVGEVRQGQGKKKFKIEGKIEENGVTDFTFTERLKDAGADDIVGNARFHGTFKDDRLTAKFAIPGDNPRGGVVELKKVDSKSN